MVIFESLERQKKQKIINFTEHIATIKFNSNKSLLFAAGAQINLERNKANIYVLSAETLKIMNVIL